MKTLFASLLTAAALLAATPSFAEEFTIVNQKCLVGGSEAARMGCIMTLEQRQPTEAEFVANENLEDYLDEEGKLPARAVLATRGTTA